MAAKDDKDDKTRSVAVAVPGTTMEAPRHAPRRAPATATLVRVHDAHTVGKPLRPRALRTFRLAPGATLLGRAAPDDGVPLADERCSRLHATLRVQLGKDGGPGSVRLQDHDTKNGSYVSGARVRDGEVADGAALRFGDTLFVLRWLRAEDERDVALPGLLGASPVMRAVRRQIEVVARTNATVLLLGETGTGKEVSARALHEASGRRGRFVAVNCAALPEQLVESQLFGHRKGAFTGADAARDGLFQDAEGGTLFLDEIGELSQAVQPKLLRVLDDKRVARVGESDARPVDVRLVAATNRDLAAAAGDGSFRGDLYARLAEITIELPPLRARREDVLPLLWALLDDDKPIDPDLAERLLCHPWPYNVRELAKLAADLRVRGQGAERYELALVERRLDRSALAPVAAVAAVRPNGDEPGDAIAAAPPTKAELEALLAAHGGNVVEVARAAGRSRKQVYRWLQKHAVDPARFR